MYFPRILGYYSTHRFYSTAPIRQTLTALTNRSIIKLTGFDIYEHLQGLITNDIKHLELRSGSLYTMFLNSKGRILFDAIIYKVKQVDTLLIDCDAACTESLIKHLSTYKLRKKISISIDDSQIYALYDRAAVNIMQSGPALNNDPASFKSVWVETIRDQSSKSLKEVALYHDPRIPLLGLRIIAPIDCNIQDILSKSYNFEVDSNLTKYRWFRFNFGVGEGVDELQSQASTPLESNCDYLHGVSFIKGCYMGQELTARTYHTGFVRKRLMPLYFDKVPLILPEDNKIIDDKGSNLGKLKGIEGDVGLGLLRIHTVLNMKEIPVGDGIARTLRPIWWPEAFKGRYNLQQN